MAERTLLHDTSRRVTAGISFHTFISPSHPQDGAPSIPDERWLRPTQTVTLQFPADLDPMAGAHGLSADERRCMFTPCGGGAGSADGLHLLTRNGRITSLLGLPRPYKTLTAQVVAVGGGFPEAVLDAVVHAGGSCIAGGTGISPFLTMGGMGGGGGGGAMSARLHLFWSIRSDDFGAVSFVLKEKLLRVEQWASVTVFVTSGEDIGGVAEKPPAWWRDTFAALCAEYAGLCLEKRRMAPDDLKCDAGTAVLFCGSKSLEWQVRMWAMGKADVYCTEVA